MDNPVTLTRKDMNLLKFSFNEYIHLLTAHHSCPQEKTIEKEKAKGDAILRKITMANAYRTKIGDDDLCFIEYLLEERMDFVAEGIGNVFVGTSRSNEAARVRKLIKKLRKWCEIPEIKDVAAISAGLSQIHVEEHIVSPKKVKSPPSYEKAAPAFVWNWEGTFEQTSIFQ